MNKDNTLLVIDDSALRKIIREESRKALDEALDTALHEVRAQASKTYNMREVCDKLGCTPPTVYKLIRQGRLNPTKIAHANIFNGLEVDNLLKHGK